MKRPALLTFFLAALLGLAGCNYDFPLTDKPTRPVDDRLIGNWASYDPDAQQVKPLVVRRLDDVTYAVSFDGDLYRVTHADVAGSPYVSVQNLQAGDDYGKFTYCSWELSPDGARLLIKTVQTKVVPADVKDAAAARRLIEANRNNPALLGDPVTFTPAKH